MKSLFELRERGVQTKALPPPIPLPYQAYILRLLRFFEHSRIAGAGFSVFDVSSKAAKKLRCRILRNRNVEPARAGRNLPAIFNYFSRSNRVMPRIVRLIGVTYTQRVRFRAFIVEAKMYLAC